MQENNISLHNLENCQKCAICVSVCPVMKNNPKYAGPKRSGPDGERYRLKNGLFYEDALKYCTNCKRCEVACPSGVRIGDLIQAAKSEHYGGAPKLRDWILANTDFMGTMAQPFAPVVNWGLGLKPVKELMHGVLGVDKHRTFPSYSFSSFVGWYKKVAAKSQASFPKQISYFHGCYANYNYPQLGKDFVKVMNAFGYGVNIMEKEKCCGVAKITNGQIASAREDAIHNMALFRESVRAGRPIVTVSTSCTMTLREEYPEVLGVDNKDIVENIHIFEKFIFQAIERGEIVPKWKPGFKARVAYHCPCHQERLGWGVYTIKLLQMIPGLELELLDSNCCGIAGTYGFKKENYEVSQKIGQPLFDNIKAVNPDYVACECETCKWQIEMSSGYEVKNPVTILAEALEI